jgi:hypothetical protein
MTDAASGDLAEARRRLDDARETLRVEQDRTVRPPAPVELAAQRVVVAEEQVQRLEAERTGPIRAMQSNLVSMSTAVAEGKVSLRSAEGSLDAAITEEKQARTDLVAAQDRSASMRNRLPVNRGERGQARQFEALAIGAARRVAAAVDLVTTRRETLKQWTEQIAALEADAAEAAKNLETLESK